MMPLKKNIIVFKNPKQPIFTVSDIPETDIHKDMNEFKIKSALKAKYVLLVTVFLI